MIQERKRGHALYALNRVLVVARFMSLKGHDPQTLAAVLDAAERLTWFLAAPQDETARYRQWLQELSSRHSLCRMVLERFDSDVLPPSWLGTV